MTNLLLISFGLLLFAGAFVQFQISQAVTQERLENRKRITAWWGILIVCATCFFADVVGVALLVLGLLVWAVIELIEMLDIKQKFIFVLFATVAACAVFLIVYLCSDALGLVIFLISLFACFVAYFFPVTSIGFLVVFYLYCLLGLVSIILIDIFASASGLDSAYLLMALFFITALSDISQYIVGRLWGKTTIAPILSPNKTLEGLLGGMVLVAILAGTLFPRVLTISFLHAATMGSLLCIAGFLGDLSVSRIKRAVNIKDSGSSIIGHGGLFDRIDSLLLIAPTFGAMCVMLGHV